MVSIKGLVDILNITKFSSVQFSWFSFTLKMVTAETLRGFVVRFKNSFFYSGKLMSV